MQQQHINEELNNENSARLVKASCKANGLEIAQKGEHPYGGNTFYDQQNWYIQEFKKENGQTAWGVMIVTNYFSNFSQAEQRIKISNRLNQFDHPVVKNVNQLCMPFITTEIIEQLVNANLLKE